MTASPGHGRAFLLGACPDLAGQGAVLLDVAGHDWARRGVALSRRGSARLPYCGAGRDLACPGQAGPGLGWAGHGAARRGGASLHVPGRGRTSTGLARQDPARHVPARKVAAWRGQARHGYKPTDSVCCEMVDGRLCNRRLGHSGPHRPAGNRQTLGEEQGQLRLFVR